MSKFIFAGVFCLSLVATAHAADLPYRGAPRVPDTLLFSSPTLDTWTGPYGGLTAGWGFAESKAAAAPIGKFNGAMIGGTLGYNHQFGDVVLGVEADATWDAMRASGKWTVDEQPVTGSARLNYVATARARVGYAYDSALLYLTTGYAGGQLSMTVNRPDIPFSGSDAKWHHGYTIGGGLEYAFTRNLSAKGEYLYTSLRTRHYFDREVTNSGATVQTFRTGVNYRF
jgi:outer membrane immunogenic protein